MTLDDIRSPAQLLDRLQDTTGEEDRTLTVVGKLLTTFVLGHGAATLEIVLIVDEVNLQSRNRNAGNLDDQRMVSVINNQVES